MALLIWSNPQINFLTLGGSSLLLCEKKKQNKVRQCSYSCLMVYSYFKVVSKVLSPHKSPLEIRYSLALSIFCIEPYLVCDSSPS